MNVDPFETIQEPDTATSETRKEDVLIVGDVLDLANCPVYEFEAAPTFANPVTLYGLGGQLVGWANLYISPNGLIYSEAFLRYGTEERLLLETGNRLYFGIKGSGDLTYGDSEDYLMPNEKIKVEAMEITGLQLVTGSKAFEGVRNVMVHRNE